MRVPVFLSALFLGGMTTSANAVCMINPSEGAMEPCTALFNPTLIEDQEAGFHFAPLVPHLVPPKKVEIQFFTLEEPVVADAEQREER